VPLLLTQKKILMPVLSVFVLCAVLHSMLPLPAAAKWFQLKRSAAVNNVVERATQTGTPNIPDLLGDTFKPITQTNQVRIVNGSLQDESVQALLATIQGMTMAANNHQLCAYLKYYAPRYTSGDNLSLEQVKGFIEETWQQYPTIQYGATLLEIRMNGNWATVESLDATRAAQITSPFARKTTVKSATGGGVGADALPSVLSTTQAETKAMLSQNKLDITSPGILETQARTLMFFHKVGEKWLVESDRTLYETALLRFGDIRNVGLAFSVPDQVFAGEGYTAQVQAMLPPNTAALSTLNREAVVFPHPKPRDLYQPLTGSRSRLERVFEANSMNRNEMVSISMGLLKAVPQNQGAISLDVVGLVTLVKRVNVIPKLSEVAGGSTESLLHPLVKTSADGKLDFSKEEEPNMPFGGGAAAIPTPMP
jgi:hypothetical protein